MHEGKNYKVGERFKCGKYNCNCKCGSDSEVKYMCKGLKPKQDVSNISDESNIYLVQQNRVMYNQIRKGQSNSL